MEIPQQILQKDSLETPVSKTGLISFDVYPRPETVQITPQYSKTMIGLFVKQEIKYLFDYCEAMHIMFWKRHPFRKTFPEASEESRTQFFVEFNDRMKQENQFLSSIFYTILVGCLHLIRLHEHAKAPKEYLNLQRRKLWLLTLCLNVIIDSRVCSHEGPDGYFLNGDENTLRLDRPTIFDVHNNWVSGVNPEASRRAMTRLVRISINHAYAPNTNPHVQLPAHFVQLLEDIYGKEFKIKADTMRKLCTSYAIYLAHIIWFPKQYKKLMKDRMNYQTILGTDLSRRKMKEDNYVPDPSKSSFIAKRWKETFDEALVPKRPEGKPIPPDPEMDGVDPRQEDINDWTTEQNYIKMLSNEKILETVGCRENDGIWCRMMLKEQ